MARKAFSVLELLVGVSIVAIVLLVGLLGLRRQTDRGQVQSLAREVASELEAARSRALQNGWPVAVVFPTNGGAAPHCQSLYLLEGYTAPRVARSRDYASEYPGGVLFLGQLSGLPSSTGAPAGVPGRLPADPDAWLGPHSADQALIFSPSGTVQSNSLPVFGQDYVVAVGEGVTYGGAPPTATASKLGEPVLIRVSPAGDVSLISAPEVLRATGRLPLNGPAPALVAAPGANSPPRVLKVAVSPPQGAVQLSQGVDVGSGPESLVRITVQASDNDGDPLYITWSADDGLFSVAGEARLEWDEQHQHFSYTVEWRPPTTAAHGDDFSLSATLTDKVHPPVPVSLGTGTQLAVRYTDQGMIVTSIPSAPVALVRPDGTKYTSIPGTDGGQSAHLSPDGQWVVYADAGQVYAVRPDGTDLHQVGATTGNIVGGISIQGRVLAVSGGNQLVWYDVTGAGTPHVLVNAPNVGWSDWDAAGTRVVYTDTTISLFNTARVMTLAVDAAGNPVGAPTFVANGMYPSFSPTGQFVAFSQTNGPGTDVYVKRVSGGGGDPGFILPGASVGASWAPGPVDDEMACDYYDYTGTQPSQNYTAHRFRLTAPGVSERLCLPNAFFVWWGGSP